MHCIVLCCIELCCAVLYCITLNCIAYGVRESKNPAVFKNGKIRAKLFSCIEFVWEMEAPGDGLRAFFGF